MGYTMTQKHLAPRLSHQTFSRSLPNFLSPISVKKTQVSTSRLKVKALPEDSEKALSTKIWRPGRKWREEEDIFAIKFPMKYLSTHIDQELMAT
jgi:hypothetical protein